MSATTSDSEQIQLAICLQLCHLAVAIVPPVERVPQFEKGCPIASEERSFTSLADANGLGQGTAASPQEKEEF